MIDGIGLTILGLYVFMGARRGALASAMRIAWPLLAYGTAFVGASLAGPLMARWFDLPRLLGLALAGVIFLWQFPHFMAIAWLYRREYAAAGHQMLPVVDPTGLRCAAQAVVGALVLIPISLIPSLSSAGGSPLVYFVWTLCLGLTQFGLAVRFALRRDEASARLLLRATLFYLPAWLAMLLMVTM